MCDEITESLIEDCEDAALALAMDDFAAGEGARLLNAFESAEARQEVPDFPPELDKLCQQRIRRYFKRQHRQRQLQKASPPLARVACTALVFFGLCMVLACSADAFVQPEVNYIYTQCDGYATMQYRGIAGIRQSLGEAPAEAVLLSKNDPLNGRIPGEYSLYRSVNKDDAGMCAIYLTDERSIILLNIGVAQGNVRISTAETVVETVCLNNVSAILVTGNGRQTVHWADTKTNLSFSLSANDLTREDFLVLANWIAEYPYWANVIMRG